MTAATLEPPAPANQDTTLALHVAGQDTTLAEHLARSAQRDHAVLFPEGYADGYGVPDVSNDSRAEVLQAMGERGVQWLRSEIQYADVKLRELALNLPGLHSFNRDGALASARAFLRDQNAAIDYLTELGAGNVPAKKGIPLALLKWLPGVIAPDLTELPAVANKLQTVEREIAHLLRRCSSDNFPARNSPGSDMLADIVGAATTLMRKLWAVQGPTMEKAFPFIRFNSNAGAPWPQRSPLHLAMVQLSDLRARRAELVAEHADLEAAARAIPALVAEAVGKALAIAGGRKKVVELVYTMQCVRLDSTSELVTLMGRRKQLEDKIAEIEASGLAKTEFGIAKQRERDEVEAARVKARADLVAARKRDAETLVHEAEAGNEQSRAALETVLRSDAACTKLATAIAACRLDRVILARLGNS